MNQTVSVAGAMAERLAEQLRDYRAFVARAARREWLSASDTADIEKLLRHLGLPEYAWRRDVRAAVEALTAQGYRRAELTVLHPHLFEDESEWVRRRLDAVQRSRRSGVTWPL